MGIFTGIGAITPDATRYKKHIRSLERQKAEMMLNNANAAIAFREKEDPREQAHLKQSMWGRGLGKSSISDQDTERLNMIQEQRRKRNADALLYAVTYKRMIRRKHRWQKVSQYYEAIDGIIGLAGGASGSASLSYGEGGGDGGGGGGFGGAGDYNYGGSSNYA